MAGQYADVSPDFRPPNGKWAVRDTRAVTKPRNHRVAPDVAYDLHAERWCLMPPEHAAIFLKSPSFVVLTEQRRIVPTLPQGETSQILDERPPIPEGQVVAKLEELTQDALLARAVQRPDGREITRQTPKAKLIALLRSPIGIMPAAPPQAPEPVPDDPIEKRKQEVARSFKELGGEELTDEEAKALLAKKAADAVPAGPVASGLAAAGASEQPPAQ